MTAALILTALLIATHLYMKARARQIWRLANSDEGRGLTIEMVRQMKRKFWKPIKSWRTNE